VGARGRLALCGVAALALLLALAPGQLAPASLRAVAAVTVLGAAVVLLRSRLSAPAAARRLAVVARQALSREAGVALLEVDGRAVLVGFGASGVRLLSPHGPAPALEPGVHPRSLLEVHR
jgi:flagellar protein FliO/FliZ